MAEGNCHIAYDNKLLFDDAGITVTSQADGFPGSNATTWMPVERWKTTGGGNQFYQVNWPIDRTVNCFAIYGHNLHEAGGQVRLQVFIDGTSLWNTISAVYTFTTSAPLFIVMPTTTTQNAFRLWFEASSPFSVGNIFIGDSFQLEAPPGDGFRPPIFSQNPEIRNNRAQNGNVLGRTLLRTDGDLDYSFAVNDETWSRANLPTVKEAMEAHPFYFAWDSVNYPQDVGFCYTERNGVQIQYSNFIYHSLRLRSKILTR